MTTHHSTQENVVFFELLKKGLKNKMSGKHHFRLSTDELSD